MTGKPMFRSRRQTWMPPSPKSVDWRKYKVSRRFARPSTASSSSGKWSAAIASTEISERRDPSFNVARLEQLRIEIDVPQSVALKVKPGTPAKMTFAEMPGQQFDAKVVRTSQAINQVSGTMRAELVMDNPGLTLPAGLTGQVLLDIERDSPCVLVPGNALVVRQGRTVCGNCRRGRQDRVSACADQPGPWGRSRGLRGSDLVGSRDHLAECVTEGGRQSRRREARKLIERSRAGISSARDEEQ